MHAIKLIDVRDVQLLKASPPIAVHAGKYTDERDEQPSKALLPIVVHHGKLTDVSDEQYMKAQLPIVTQLLKGAAFVNAVKPEKTPDSKTAQSLKFISLKVFLQL